MYHLMGVFHLREEWGGFILGGGEYSTMISDWRSLLGGGGFVRRRRLHEQQSTLLKGGYIEDRGLEGSTGEYDRGS